MFTARRKHSHGRDSLISLCFWICSMILSLIMDSKSLTPYSNTLSFMETQSRFSHSTVIFANLLKNLQTCKWTYCSTFLTKITATCKNTLGASAFCIFTVRQICYDVIMTWLTSRTDSLVRTHLKPRAPVLPSSEKFKLAQAFVWYFHWWYISGISTQDICHDSFVQRSKLSKQSWWAWANISSR